MSVVTADIITKNHRTQVLKHFQQKKGLLSKPLLPEISICSEDIYKPFPMNRLQKLYCCEPHGKSHMYIELEFKGALDKHRLEQVLHKLVERHPMLKARVSNNGQYQLNETIPDTFIKEMDWSFLKPESIEKKFLEIRKKMIDSGPSEYPELLFEMTLCKMNNQRFILCFVISLLIDDGLSNTIFIKEMESLYFAPERPLDPIDLTYRDYVLALERFKASDQYKQSKTYWQKRIAFLPRPILFPWNDFEGYKESPFFMRHTATLDEKDWVTLKEKAKQNKVTPSSVLMGSFSKALSDLSGNTHFIFFIMNANRLPLHPHVNKIFGNFSSSSVFEADLREFNGIEAYVKSVQNQMIQDLKHGEITGAEILHELNDTRLWDSEMRMPVVFSCNLFAAEAFGKSRDQKDIDSVRIVWNSLQRTLVDLDIQVNEEADRLTLNCDSVIGKYGTEFIELLLETFKKTLKTYAFDIPPSKVSSTGLTQRPLFTFRKQGDNSPVFCVHPVGGGVIVFKALADNLDTSHPFYAFQAQGLYGDTGPINSIKKMASLYNQSLLSLHKQGPVILSGYSFGGLVAFEMANQLIQAGREVSTLMVFDGAAPVYVDDFISGNWDQLFSMNDGKWLIMVSQLMEKSMKIKLNLSKGKFIGLPPEKQEEKLIASFMKESDFHGENGQNMIRHMLNVNKANYRAMLSYFPDPIPCGITVFKSEQKVGNDSILTFYKNYHEEDLGWGRYSREPVDVITVPGDHYSMLNPPHVFALAKKINDHLTQITRLRSTR